MRVVDDWDEVAGVVLGQRRLELTVVEVQKAVG